MAQTIREGQRETANQPKERARWNTREVKTGKTYIHRIIINNTFPKLKEKNEKKTQHNERTNESTNKYILGKQRTQRSKKNAKEMKRQSGGTQKMLNQMMDHQSDYNIIVRFIQIVYVVLCSLHLFYVYLYEFLQMDCMDEFNLRGQGKFVGNREKEEEENKTYTIMAVPMFHLLALIHYHTLSQFVFLFIFSIITCIWICCRSAVKVKCKNPTL